MSDAAQQVLLNIHECLEVVLLEVDEFTLLTTAQRVCKTWHDKIQTSLRLREKLFLPTGRKNASETSASIRRTQNPLLTKAFPAFFTSLEPPALRNRTDPYDIRELMKQQCYTRKGASWRTMFVEYPVRHKIGYIENKGISQQSYYSGVLDVPEGVTMGKLYDMAYSLTLGDKPSRGKRFGVYWREKEKDPTIHEYSWKGGAEEVSLSKMGEDIKIVVCMNNAGQSARQGWASKRTSLSKVYMPENFEFVKLQLGCTNSQDWFG